MKKTINIKNGIAEFEKDGQKVRLDDLIIDISDGIFFGSYRADYILQVIREYEKYPSKFSIAKKLKKYTKETPPRD